MKQISLLLLVPFLLITSCSSDDNNDGVDNKTKELTLTVNIKNDKKEADPGSIVYILEGFTVYNGGNWTYTKNGSFKSERWGTGWSYTKSAIADNSGVAVIKNVSCPKDQPYFTIVIESASDKDSEKRYIPIAAYDAEGKDISINYIYGTQIK